MIGALKSKRSPLEVRASLFHSHSHGLVGRVEEGLAWSCMHVAVSALTMVNRGWGGHKENAAGCIEELAEEQGKGVPLWALGEDTSFQMEMYLKIL